MPTIEEFNDIIFYEYWFITIPICLLLIIIVIVLEYLEKKRFKEEDVLLDKMGFNRIAKPLNLNLPSNTLKGIWNPVKNKNPITSEKYPHILIYLREMYTNISPEGGQRTGLIETRILRIKSKTNKKFPKFILSKAGFFDKFRSNIDYRNNPEFSKKFFLKSLEEKENKIEVEKLFKNFSLQNKLISNPINIESNGNDIFYYWDRVKFRIEELPKRISDVKFLHDNFFDL